MNVKPDPETILAAWLDEGPMDLPDSTRRAILTSLPATPQARRGLFAPRRFPPMNSITRLAAAALVAVVAVGGATYLFGRSSPGAGVPPSVSPTPSVSGPPATACRLDLIPTLLMSTNCTYGSTLFKHPITVVSDGSWLVGGESSTWVSFQGYGHEANVTLLVFGSIGEVADDPCVTPNRTPGPSGETPRSAAAFVSWLRSNVPALGTPVETTVGGLPALRFDISYPAVNCRGDSWSLAWSQIGTDNQIVSFFCSGGQCRLFVIDHDGDVVLIGINGIAVPPFEPSSAEAATTFLDGLRFVP